MYNDLITLVREKALLDSTAAVIGWDERTYMPPKGSSHRADQMALLAKLSHAQLTSPRIGELLTSLEATPTDDANQKANLREIRRAYDLLKNEFSAGLLSPVEIVVQGDREQVEPALAELVTMMEDSGDFAPLTGEPVWSEDNGTVLLGTTLLVAGDTEGAYDVIRWLRDEALPSTVEGAGADSWVTGDPAFNLDFITMVSDYTPIVFIFECRSRPSTPSPRSIRLAPAFFLTTGFD